MALLSAGEAQRVLSCSRVTVLAYVKKGKLNPLVDSRGWRWFDAEAVYRLALARFPQPIGFHRPSPQPPAAQLRADVADEAPGEPAVKAAAAGDERGQIER